MITRAVIVAGGKGTRLSGVSQEIPKPMFPLEGKPVLEHIIEMLRRNGVRDVTMLTGHLGEKIREYFGNGNRFGLDIIYHQETQPLGTAGCVLQCSGYIEDNFLVIYGDLIAYLKLTDLFAFHESRKPAATLVVHPNNHPQDSDIVEMDENCVVRRIIFKDHKPEFYPNCANSAVYVMSRSVLDHIPPRGPSDFMKDVFPKMIERGERILGYRTAEYVKDMGTVDRLAHISEDLKSGKPARRSKDVKRSAVFIDRDGTLVKKIELLHKAEDLDLYPFAASALKILNESDFLSILITNQPVVARNLCGMEDVRLMHNKMETILGKDGSYLDDIFFCPHHPDRGYPEENKAFKIDCDCRKPKTGMIIQAAERHNIDLESSWMIGDTSADIQTGINAGLKTVLVRTGDGGRDGKFTVQPDFSARDLEEAVDIICLGCVRYGDHIERIAHQISGVGKADPFVILIGGQARSGKSTFAGFLRSYLEKRNIPCRCVSLDNWLLDIAERNRNLTVRGRYNYAEITQDIRKMIGHEEVPVKVYDSYLRTSTRTKTVSIGDAQCLIIEGVPALDIGDLRTLSHLKIFIDANETARSQRLIDFYRWKGLDDEKIANLMIERLQDEVPLIQESRKYADIIIEATLGRQS